MTVLECYNESEAIALQTENKLNKIGVFAEAAYGEYSINLQEAALKVMEESGTMEDYAFLAQEAGNAFTERISKAIAAIVEAVRNFIDDCKDRLENTIYSEKNKSAIKKVEKACDENPMLRSKKVKYEDPSEKIDYYEKTTDKVMKIILKAKTGNAKGKDLKELDKIDAEIERKRHTIQNAIIVSTVAAACALFYKNYSNIKADLSKLNVNELKSVSNGVPATATPESINTIVKGSGIIGKLKKETASLKVFGATSLISALKDSVAELSGKVKSVNLESVLEEGYDESMEELYEESTSMGESEGLDMDSYYAMICDEVFSESTKEESEETGDGEDGNTEVVQESAEDVDDDEPDYHETYLKQLGDEIFGESTEDGILDDEEVIQESVEDKPDSFFDEVMKEMEDLIN